MLFVRPKQHKIVCKFYLKKADTVKEGVVDYRNIKEFISFF